jgi:hypothetical protein
MPLFHHIRQNLSSMGASENLLDVSYDSTPERCPEVGPCRFCPRVPYSVHVAAEVDADGNIILPLMLHDVMIASHIIHNHRHF